MVESWVLAVLDEGEPRARLAGGCKARLAAVMKGGLCQCAHPPVYSTPESHPREGKGKQGGGRLSHPMLFPCNAGILRGLITTLTFPAGCICTGTGVRPGVQGRDAELGDAWDAGRTAENSVSN